MCGRMKRFLRYLVSLLSLVRYSVVEICPTKFVYYLNFVLEIKLKLKNIMSCNTQLTLKESFERG